MIIVLQKAREEMKKRNYSYAIDLFNEHLKNASSDLVPLMQLGICHLLNGSDENFLRIHKKVKILVKKMTLNGDIKALWEQYRSLVFKVTATTLVIGSLAMGETAASGHKYSGGVYEKEPVPEQVGPAEEKNKQGDIKINNMSYQKMEGEEWEAKGRIVGLARGAPLPYKVEIQDSNWRVVAVTELFVKFAVYEIWLLPGTYAIVVKADGYPDHSLTGIEIKAGYDLQIDFEFSDDGKTKEDALIDDN